MPSCLGQRHLLPGKPPCRLFSGTRTSVPWTRLMQAACEYYMAACAIKLKIWEHLTQMPALERMEDGLEWLGSCPCCRGTDRELLYSGLQDLAFAAAPGTWTMWSCSSCQSAYLDPRLRPDAISEAYRNYYTHYADAGDPFASASGQVSRQRLKQRLAAALFWVSQTSLGSVATKSGQLRSRVSRIGHRVRHLPVPRKNTTVLDIGCGSGSFLNTASLLGYRVIGIDNDAEAVKVARSRGFDVRLASVPGAGFQAETFDHVTLDNVFEHLHQPLEALKEIFSLLKPGGRAWLSLPNLGALGLQEFGVFWRGLEAPRHLTLWNFEALSSLMRKAGLADVSLMETNSHSLRSYFARSERQRQGLKPDVSDEELARQSWDTQTEDRFREAEATLERGDWTKGESLTIIAYRPSS